MLDLLRRLFRRRPHAARPDSLRLHPDAPRVDTDDPLVAYVVSEAFRTGDSIFLRVNDDGSVTEERSRPREASRD